MMGVFNMRRDKMDKLPDKPSELLSLALEDLQKCEKDPRYSIDMDVWHEGEDMWLGISLPCYVCMAGALMVHELDADIHKILLPDTFDDDTEIKLLAVDDLRRGHVATALDILGISNNAPYRPTSRRIHSYHTDRDLFITDIKCLIEDLKNAGY